MKNKRNSNCLNRYFMSVVILLAVCLFLSCPAFAVQCVNPNGTGGCFDSIQDAVDAAIAGEKVKVRPGNYYEYVMIPPGKDGLILVGTGKSRNDVQIIGEPGSGVQVINSGSGDVIIENLTVLHGDGIIMGGGPNTGARIVNVKVINASFDCINILGTAGQPRNAVINKCDLSGNQGINGAGDGFKVRNTKIRCFNYSINLNGNDALVENCVSTDSSSGDVIHINGNNSTVRNTRVTSKHGIHGIALHGNNALVEENEIKGVAILVIGENPLVKNNLVEDEDGAPMGYNINCNGDCSQARVVNNISRRSPEGFYISSSVPGMVIKKNKALFCSDHGFYLAILEAIVTENVARSCLNHGFLFQGSGNNNILNNISEKNGLSGFSVGSIDNVLTKNTSIKNQQSGFHIAGTGIDLFNNKANDNLQDGIHVPGNDNTFTGNTARRNIFTGIHVGGSLNVVQNNTALGNHPDICDTSGPPGNTWTDNVYDTECP